MDEMNLIEKVIITQFEFIWSHESLFSQSE